MNTRQKTYDRYDQINRLMKISNNYYLYRNLAYISNRKGRYPSTNNTKISNSNKLITEPYSNYYVIRENEVYQKMINDIRFQPIKQKKIDQQNKDFNKRMNDYRKQNKKIEEKLLAIKNENYKKRINMQKGVINTKKFDDSYNNYHLKMLRQIRNTKSVVLPPIAEIMRRNSSSRKIKIHEKKNSEKIDKNYEEKKKEKKEEENKEEEQE